MAAAAASTLAVPPTPRLWLDVRIGPLSVLSGCPRLSLVDCEPLRCGDVVVMDAGTGDAAELRRLIALSGGYPFTKWLVCCSGAHSDVAEMLPPGSHALLPPPGDLTPELALHVAARLSGLGPQHMRIHWTGGSGLAERALCRLFEAADAGPTLGAVARDLGARPSAVARAIRQLTSLTHETIRRRRAVAWIEWTRSHEGTTFREAAERLKVQPRTARRWRRECGCSDVMDVTSTCLAILRGHP